MHAFPTACWGWTIWLTSSSNNARFCTEAQSWRHLQSWHHGVKSPFSIMPGPQKKKPPHTAWSPIYLQDWGIAPFHATHSSPWNCKIGWFLKREGVTASQSCPPAWDRPHHFYPFLLRLRKRYLIKLAHLTEMTHIKSSSGDSNFFFFFFPSLIRLVLSSRQQISLNLCLRKKSPLVQEIFSTCTYL